MPPTQQMVDVTRVAGTRVCVANPVTVDTTQADTIAWRNNTNDDIIVFFPHDGVFDHNGKTHFHHKINRGGPPFSAGRADAGKAGRTFRYVIFCLETGTFAVGGSDPEVIIT